MSDLDVGTLTGRVEIEDTVSSTFEKIASKVEQFGEYFEGALGSMAVATSAVVIGLGAITSAILTLGDKGSEVNDVKDSFDRLGGGVQNADGILAEMRKGVAGTIDDMTLMADANRVLESGVGANAATFGTMTQAARVLSREGFGSIPDVLDQVNRGMQTGIMRGPLLKSMHVDLTAAEQHYADTMGTTSDRLTKNQKLLADRGALIEGLSTVVQRAGDQETNLKERIEAAGVAVQNWGLKLAASIASSPHVTDAFNKIGDAITRNFGGSGQTAIEKITGWVNEFADLAAEYGPKIVDEIVSIAHSIKDVYTQVIAAWDATPTWLKHIAENAALASVAVYAVSKATGGVTGPDILSGLGSAAQVWTALGTNVTRAATATKEWMAIMIAFKWEGVSLAISSLATGIGALAVTPLGVAALLTGLGVAIYGVGKAVHDAYEWWKDGKPMWDFFTQKDDDNFVRRWLGLSRAATDGGDALKYLASQRASLEAMMHAPTSSPSAAGGSGGTTPDPLSAQVLALRNTLSGKDVTLQIDDMTKALKEAGGAANISAPQLMAFGAQLDGMVKKGSPLNPQLNEAYELWRDNYQAIEENKQALKDLAEYEKGEIDALKERDVWASQTRTAAIANIDAVAQKRSSDLQSQMETTKATASNVAVSYDDQFAAITHYYDLKRQADQLDYDSTVRQIRNREQTNVDSVKGLGDDAALARKSYHDLAQSELDAAAAAHNFTDTKTDIDQVNDAVSRLNDRYGQTVVTMGFALQDARAKYADMQLQGGAAVFGIVHMQQALEELRQKELNFYAETHKGWKDTNDDLTAVGAGLGQIGAQMNGWQGSFVAGMGGVIGNLVKWRETLALVGTQAEKTFTAADKLSAIMGGAASVMSATSGPNKTQDVVGGAMQGAMAGAGIAMMSGAGTATMGVAIAVGALAGAITGYIRAGKQAQQMQEALDSQLDDMHTQVTASFGSWSQASDMANRLGVAFADATGSMGHHSTEDIGRVRDQMNALDAAVKAVQDDAKTLGLTWADMDLADATKEATTAADALVKRQEQLKAYGYDINAIQSKMAPDVNSWLSSALQAGVKIPASMQPIIENLIKTHQLTEDNAKALLGIKSDGVPSLDDISAAAGRWGLKLDELGGKVPQLSINAQADQIAADFATLTAAGVPFEQIFKDTSTDVTDAAGNVTTSTVGMHNAIQDMVTKATGPLGVDLPESMKPIIQKMIDLGGPNGLVDAAGNQLTDLSTLKFSKPIADKIDELITHLDTLVDHLDGKTGSVTSSTNSMSTKTQGAFGAMGGALDGYQLKLKGLVDYTNGLTPPAPPGVPFPGMTPPGGTPTPTPTPAPTNGSGANGASATRVVHETPISFELNGEVLSTGLVRTFVYQGL